MLPPAVDDEADEVDEDEAEKEGNHPDDEENFEEATAEDISCVFIYFLYDHLLNPSSEDEDMPKGHGKNKNITTVEDSDDEEYVEIDTRAAKRTGRAVTPDSPRVW